MAKLKDGEREFLKFDPASAVKVWEGCPDCHGIGKVTQTLPPGERPKLDDAGHAILTVEVPCKCATR